MPEDDLKEQIQCAMRDFLRIDSDLAFTFLQTAAIESHSDPRHAEAALKKARVALHTIRPLAVQIEDAAQRREINSRLDELEAAINDFGKPRMA
jgi:hypothetical protein